jgi:hypothetical protein
MSSIATAIVMLLSALPVIVEDTNNTLLLKRLIRLKKQQIEVIPVTGLQGTMMLSLNKKKNNRV